MGLHGSVLGPLHICYSGVASCFYRTPNSGDGVSLTLLPALETSYWVASPTLDMRVCVWSYCILLCHVWLMSLGGLIFSGVRLEGEWIWRREEVEEARRSGRKGACNWDVLYERRIN